MTYKQYRDGLTGEVSEYILRTDDGIETYIPNDPDNSSWQEYQAWLALGNEPEPVE